MEMKFIILGWDVCWESDQDKCQQPCEIIRMHPHAHRTLLGHVNMSS